MSGLSPQTPTKGLFVKSPLEPQKLVPKEIGVFGGNSLAYLSYKKGKAHLSPKEKSGLSEPQKFRQGG